MTREDAKEYLINISYKLGSMSIEYLTEKDGEKMREAIYALEQEPCEDAISRQAVEKITWEESSYIDPINALTEVREKIRALSSVTPQKVRRWIRVDKDKLKCSECKVIHFIAQYPQSANINFCPNCGAKMEVTNCE